MMRKLFLIIITAFITANTSALEFSGQITGSLNILSGDSNPDTEKIIMGGNEIGKLYLETRAEKENFGAQAGLEASNIYSGIISASGYIFFKPNDYFDIFITRKPANNGHWALDGDALQGFYGFAREVIVTDYHSYDGSINIPMFDNAFYSGFTDGAFVSFKAFDDDLKINFGLPVFQRDAIGNVLKSLTLQLSYNLFDLGLAGITYEGGANERQAWDDSPLLFFYFNFKKVKNANFDIGLGLRLPEENERKNEKRSYPINFGLAAFFNNEKFGFKARLLVSAFGKIKYANMPDANNPFDILFDMLPSVSFSSGITGYLNTGFNLRILNTGETSVLWHINPYFVFGNMSTGAFYLGFRIDNRGTNNNRVYWSLPAGISFSF